MGISNGGASLECEEASAKDVEGLSLKRGQNATKSPGAIPRVLTTPQGATPSSSPFKLSYSKARSLAAADSGVMSRWGWPSISKPTLNLRTLAERSNGG